MNAHFSNIVTHDKAFDAEQLFAIATVIITLGWKPKITRTCNMKREWFADPGTFVISTGRRHEPKQRNFDYRQDKKLPASNILVLNALSPPWKNAVWPLFEHVSDQSLGIIPVIDDQYEINRIIDVHNSIRGGFGLALSLAMTTMQGFISRSLQPV